MSIFKESFRNYIKNQFNTRQKVIASGNKDKNSLSRLYHGFDNLVPGAFYAYQQKQCVIRMSSLVDLMKDIDLDLGVTQPDGTRYGTPFSSYKGSTFARNYVLEGGVLSDYARNISETEDGTEVKVRKFDVRGGFPKPGKRANLSYGDPSLAADPDEDGYGVVPMPGITDANIRTKTAYGSLREAKINFVCHNLRQLEILELLYMRPGYPVLLEWGWSPYISNDGEIINDFPSVANYEEFWNDNLISQEFIQNEIIRQKQLTNGNYDGCLGYVTNFNYESRADGGFNCSTEIISMGEVINSLKIPGLAYSKIDKDLYNDLEENDKKEVMYQSSLGSLIFKLNSALNARKEAQDATSTWEVVKRFTANSLQYGAAYGGLFEAAVQQGAALTIEQSEKDLLYLLSLAYPGINTASENEEINIDSLDAHVKSCMIPKGTFITEPEDEEGDTIEISDGFIKWEFLAELFNQLIIPVNEKGTPPVVLSCNRSKTTDNVDQIDLEPILYAKYDTSVGRNSDISCDPNICILPHQFADFQDDDKNYSREDKILLTKLSVGLTASPLMPLGIALGAWAAGQEYLDENRSVLGIIPIDEDIQKRRIGGIYINFKHIKKTFEQVYTNDINASLGDFITKLWEGINKACPLHNFALRNDFERPNIVQIIDLPLTNDDLQEDLNYDELFTFNVLSNDTIVRNFKYNTQIPSALKATIAINAQSGASAEDLDSVTFAAFNEAIKSRLHSLSEKFTERESLFHTKNSYNRSQKQRRLRDILEKIKEFSEDFFNYLDRGENDIKDLENRKKKIPGFVKEAMSLETYLEKSTSKYLKHQSVIPLNVNLTLDGVSGVVIGNVFKIDESRLPKAYKDKNIAFVALGESQNITSGQDWTTEIRGQLILFPKEEEYSKKHQFRERLGANVADNAVAEEVEEAREAFAVAESTNNDIDTTEVDQILEDQQAEEELTDLEKLGYTLDIQSDLINNDTFWLAEDVNYPGGGNKTYVLQNQIRYEDYNSFTIGVARNAGVKVEDYKGFELIRLPSGYFMHNPDILLDGEVDSVARSDEYSDILYLKDIIDYSDNKTE